jgi:Family of unknown function (DUF6236)
LVSLPSNNNLKPLIFPYFSGAKIMSSGKALYFPYIHFQDENWLKYSLLYWDCIERIVPLSYNPQDSDNVKLLADAGIIKNIAPQSGTIPYTQTAAAEFIPTMQNYLSIHGDLSISGRLTRAAGANVSKQVERNASEALVHIQKMDGKVIQLLESSGLANRYGDWFAMDGALAAYYMLCLAAHISEKLNAPLLSDSFEMETGGTFFQHSRITTEQVGQPKDEVGFRLARMVFPLPRPENLAAVSMHKILEFYQKHGAERMQFRQAIEDAVKDAATLEDSGAVKDFLDEKKRLIEYQLNDQKQRIDELGVGTVYSLISISVPTALTPTALAALGVNPISASIMSGVFLVIGGIAWFAKARGKRRQTIRDCDWHYLLSLQQRFDAKQIAKEGQHWMQEFVGD